MIKVNEIFPSIQGEGKSIGKEVIFIRLSLCNLYCVWCDTPYTWNWEGTKFRHVSDEKFRKSDEIHLMNETQIFEEIKRYNIHNIVLSGGEPLIQQKQLIPLLKILKNEKYWIEVETNGTIVPKDEFLDLIDQVNCSPKLSNSMIPIEKRISLEALYKLGSIPKTNFKFVVSCQQDCDEISALQMVASMKEIYLMPLGATRSELAKNCDFVKLLASNYNFKFTDRVHITKLGGGRSV